MRVRTGVLLTALLCALGTAAPAMAQDPYGPDGDFDGDGVANQVDRCPGEGAGPVGTDGCRATADRDGDGRPDAEDECPDEPVGDHEGRAGCPFKAPELGPETPVAAGPSCTKAQPCLVLQAKGLTKQLDGTWFDPDGTVTVTIARDARGNPARVVSIELSKVNKGCVGAPYTTADGEQAVRVTPGEEVSATLTPLALKAYREERASGGFYTSYRFDPMGAVRTIAGTKYELRFLLDGSRDSLMVGMTGNARTTGTCSLSFDAMLEPVKGTGGTSAAAKAIAKCKKLPTATKKQRRKRNACLAKARRAQGASGSRR